MRGEEGKTGRERSVVERMWVRNQQPVEDHEPFLRELEEDEMCGAANLYRVKDATPGAWLGMAGGKTRRKELCEMEVDEAAPQQQ